MVTREKIIEAALRLAAAQGLSSLTVRRVAIEAGVGATTLRHYFPAQADLHLLVAAELARRPVDDLSIADDQRDPADRLFECLAQLLPPDGRRATVEAWFELYRMSAGADPVPGASVIVERAQRSTAEHVRRWLTILADRGAVRPEEVAGHATSALTLVNGLYLRALLNPGPADLDAAKDTIRWFAERVIDRRPAL
ncbi:TetR family transcriptional regulator C-terminal domain-containing protein [Amycolatopsis sp. NBC_00345]|uniref:TetR/AcrR family transcriptional regulator n=1 Tax=Amycolatopsis sp. NBC_00345 TaxID=2975955 RepID=UPI002E26E177